MIATAERHLIRILIGERNRSATGTCAYCGRRCWGRTCSGHRDLPQLEHDIYSQSSEPDRTPSTDARPDPPTNGG